MDMLQSIGQTILPLRLWHVDGKFKEIYIDMLRTHLPHELETLVYSNVPGQTACNSLLHMNDRSHVCHCLSYTNNDRVMFLSEQCDCSINII